MENHSDCNASTETEKKKTLHPVFVENKSTEFSAADQSDETKKKEQRPSTSKQSLPPRVLLVCYVVLRVTCAVTLTFTVVACVAGYYLEDGFESSFPAALRSMHLERDMKLDQRAARHIEDEVLRQALEVQESQNACEVYMHDLIGIIHRRISPDVHGIDPRRNSDESRQAITRFSASLTTLKSSVTNFTRAYRAKVEDAIRPWFQRSHSYLARIFHNPWLLFPLGLFNRTGTLFGFSSDPTGSRFGGVEARFGSFLNVQEVEVVQFWERKFWGRYDSLLLASEVSGDPVLHLATKSCENRDINDSFTTDQFLKRSLIFDPKEFDYKHSPTYQHLDSTRFFAPDHSNRLGDSSTRSASQHLAGVRDEEDTEKWRKYFGEDVERISWGEFFSEIRCDILMTIFVALDVLLIIYRFSRFYITLREVLHSSKRPLSSRRSGWMRFPVTFRGNPRVVSKTHTPSAMYLNSMQATCASSRKTPILRPTDASGTSRTESPLVDGRKLRFLYHLEASGISFRSWPVTGFRGCVRQLPRRRTWCSFGLGLYVRRVCAGDFLSGVLIACVVCLVLSLGIVQMSREVQALNLRGFVRLVESWTMEVARINEHLISSAEQQTQLLMDQTRSLNAMELENWQRFLHFVITHRPQRSSVWSAEECRKRYASAHNQTFCRKVDSSFHPSSHDWSFPIVPCNFLPIKSRLFPETEFLKLERSDIRQHFLTLTSISTALFFALNLCLVITALLSLLACFDRIAEDTLTGYSATIRRQTMSSSRPELTHQEKDTHRGTVRQDSCAVISSTQLAFPSTHDSVVDTKLMTANRFDSDSVLTRFTETKV